MISTEYFSMLVALCTTISNRFNVKPCSKFMFENGACREIYMKKILAEMNSIDFHPAFNVKRDQIMISC